MTSKTFIADYNDRREQSSYLQLDLKQTKRKGKGKKLNRKRQTEKIDESLYVKDESQSVAFCTIILQSFLFFCKKKLEQNKKEKEEYKR